MSHNDTGTEEFDQSMPDGAVVDRPCLHCVDRQRHTIEVSWPNTHQTKTAVTAKSRPESHSVDHVLAVTRMISPVFEKNLIHTASTASLTCTALSNTWLAKCRGFGGRSQLSDSRSDAQPRTDRQNDDIVWFNTQRHKAEMLRSSPRTSIAKCYAAVCRRYSWSGSTRRPSTHPRE